MKTHLYAFPFIIAVIIFFAGVFVGSGFVKTVAPEPVTGVVTVEELDAGMEETPPDTVFVLVRVDAEKNKDTTGPQTAGAPVITRVPVASALSGYDIDAPLNLTVMDWNTKRSYTGKFFDNGKDGTFAYAFDVQYNRAGPIHYRYDPAPVTMRREPIRLRPWAGGAYYANRQYSIDAGAQYGAFSFGVGALKLYDAGYTIGISTRFVF